MKKIAVIMLAAFVAGGSQASLIAWTGNFVTGKSTFIYDGEDFEAGWVVRMYQSPPPGNATISADWWNLAGMNALDRAELLAGGPGGDYLLAEGVVEKVTTGPVVSHRVRIATQELDVTNNINVFTVLFNTDTVSADAGKALVIGYWDGENEVAVNVGSYDPPEVYTPGDMIPGGGNIILTGNWQAIPEPATALTLFLAMAGIFGLRRLFPKR